MSVEETVAGELQRRQINDRNMLFMHEVHEGNFNEARKLLRAGGGISPAFTTGDGETALHLACRQNDIKLSSMLVASGWNFGEKCAYLNTTPYLLLKPFTKGSLEEEEKNPLNFGGDLLKRRGPNAKVANDFENSLLYFDCEDGKIGEIISKLNDTHIWYSRRFVHDRTRGETAMHGAAKFAHGNICAYLYRCGWSLRRLPTCTYNIEKTRSPVENEPSHETGLILIKASREAAENQGGRIASFCENAELWFLAEAGAMDKVAKTLTNKEIVYDRDFCYAKAKQETALHAAALNGHSNVAKYLIEQKWDPEKRNYRGESPGTLAVKFLKRLRFGVKELHRREEFKLLHRLKKRAREMSSKADASWSWVKKQGDGKLSGQFVLYTMPKLKISSNPSWSLKEKKADFDRRVLSARDKVSLGRQLYEHICNLGNYPMHNLAQYKLLVDRVQEQGDGSFDPWPQEIEEQHYRTIEAYEMKERFGRCWRCDSVLFPERSGVHEIRELRCNFCWSEEGGLYDSFIRAPRY